MRCLWTDQTYHISPAWWWKRTSGLPFPVKVAYSGVFAFDLQDFWGIFLTCCDHLHHSRCGRHHYRHRTITIKSLFGSISLSNVWAGVWHTTCSLQLRWFKPPGAVGTVALALDVWNPCLSIVGTNRCQTSAISFRTCWESFLPTFLRYGAS